MVQPLEQIAPYLRPVEADLRMEIQNAIAEMGLGEDCTESDTGKKDFKSLRCSQVCHLHSESERMLDDGQGEQTTDKWEGLHPHPARARRPSILLILPARKALKPIIIFHIRVKAIAASQY